jgi:NADH-quinone oxidoreductase subunit M
MIQQHLLTLTVAIPIVGAILVLLAPKSAARAISIAASFLAMVATLLVAGRFVPDGGMQFVEQHSWIRSFNIEYYLGVDGISVTMVALTGILSFICILASWEFDHWSVNKGIKGYFALFLLLEAGMMGVFESLDFFLFYVFWEMMLLPMYFLIGIWGGPRREYAAIKFFLYTLAGSVLMFVVMIAMYFMVPDQDPKVAGHQGTFNLLTLAEIGPKLFNGGWWKAAFIGLYIGFAIKVPVFPFHTWLPDAHVDAPTPISVLLAGILLKMGGYGFFRISYPIFPEGAQWFGLAMAILGMINIVYGAFVAMAQTDFKRLVAYSSVSHMGFVLLGLSSFTPEGMNGALLQMFNHGTITGGMFLLVGVLYDRSHTRDLSAFGGLGAKLPVYAGILTFFSLASLGLPGLSGFVSEFLSLVGTFGVWRWQTVVSVLGIVVTAAYMLTVLQRVLLGPLNERWTALPDMNQRELVTLVPLLLMILLVGVYPLAVLRLQDASVQVLLQLLRP